MTNLPARVGFEKCPRYSPTCIQNAIWSCARRPNNAFTIRRLTCFRCCRCWSPTGRDARTKSRHLLATSSSQVPSLQQALRVRPFHLSYGERNPHTGDPYAEPQNHTQRREHEFDHATISKTPANRPPPGIVRGECVACTQKGNVHWLAISRR